MADHIVKKTVSIFCDVFVKVAFFIFAVDFLILDCEVNFDVPIILGRPFQAIGRELVGMEMGQIKFRLNDEHVTFNVCQWMRLLKDMQVVSVIDTMEKNTLTVPIKERHRVEALAAMIMNFDSDGIDKYDEIVNTLIGQGFFLFTKEVRS